MNVANSDPKSIAIADIRRDYRGQALLENDIDPDPLKQFQIWFKQAVDANLRDPNGMTLATVTPDGKPAARIVLLKNVDARGFVFYTNYDSRKGQELDQTPWAALVFWWSDLDRQVRIEGSVTKITEAEADTYFQNRPRGSQLGAWVSEQSQVIRDRLVLEQQLEQLQKQYQGQSVPRPSHWGGYRLCPTQIEFWQGRPDRLHDRLCYRLTPQSDWQLERLAP